MSRYRKIKGMPENHQFVFPSFPSALAILLVVLVLTGLSSASDIKSLGPPDVKMPLLEGRLFVCMPKGSIEEPRGCDIMSAQISVLEETRIVLESDSRKIVLMVHEIFAIAGGDFAKIARERIAHWEQRGVGTLAIEERSRSGLKAVRFTPEKLLFRGDAGLAGGAYIMLPDRTVVVLAVYANEAAGSDVNGCLALADGILSTVSPGDRKLNTAGRLGFLETTEEGREIEVDIPPAWIITCRYGMSFLIYRVMEMAPFGRERKRKWIGIYIGGHPSFEHDDETGEGEVTRVSDYLLGKRTEWVIHEVKVDDGTKYLCREAMVPAGETERGFYVHVFMNAPDREGISRLMEIVDTMRFHGDSRFLDKHYWLLVTCILATAATFIILLYLRRNRPRVMSLSNHPRSSIEFVPGSSAQGGG
jgi:hypothetical protein